MLVIDDVELAAECEILIRTPNKGRIAAIKRVREVKRLSLKEAMDWVVGLDIKPITHEEMLNKAKDLRRHASDLIYRAERYEADAMKAPR